jgi:hypothetical protein
MRVRARKFSSFLEHPTSQAAFVPQARDLGAPRNCGALKEDWHSSQDAGTIRHPMKSLLRAIVVSLSIFAVFSATNLAEAGPFGDFFSALRRSFARPAPKPRPPQSRRSSPKKNNQTQPSDASDASNGSTGETSPSPTPVPAPPNRDNVRVAKATAARKNRKDDLPYGIPVPGKQGLVTSPFSPDSGYIDVRSFPPGTEVRDPYTGKIFLTP